jgi:hypothetical protein
MSNFKDAAPSTATMVANILNLYAAADDVAVFEGTHWYDQARTFASTIAERYSVTTDVAACVIAAHSMNASWKANMTRAVNQLSGSPTGLTAAIRMAHEAMTWDTVAAGDIPAYDSPFDAIVGPKINPFARCVAGDLNAVATDRWAQRAAFDTLDDKKATRWIKRNGMRDNMIEAYALAAGSVGIAPAVMQAIVWVVVRGSAD